MPLIILFNLVNDLLAWLWSDATIKHDVRVLEQ